MADSSDDRKKENQSRVMRVAEALSLKESDEFAKPGNLVEVRFVKGQSLSLTASRLLALMILSAGGDAWRDLPHRIRKAEIRRGHKGNERIVDMLEELHRTLFAEDDSSWRGRRATKRFPLIQMSKEEVEEDGSETGWIEWEFTPDARRLIQESESYAVLNRQAVLGFRSAYSLKLYEIGAMRIHRRSPVWKCDVLGLRSALGISPSVYKDFAQLRRKVLHTAKREIDQLAHFTVEWAETKRGRSVAELEFRFVPKDAPKQLRTVDELQKHSAGREARRDSLVERVEVADHSTADVHRLGESATRSLSSRNDDASFKSFPSGSIRWAGAEEFLNIARRHGGGWDVDLLANSYRQFMGDRLAKLSGSKLKKSWKGFCESYVARQGRP